MWHKPQAMTWLSNLLYGLAVLLVVYAVIYGVVHYPGAFPLHEVRLKGKLKHVTQSQVSYVVDHEIRGNFFTLDLDGARRSFEKLPWVKQVSLRRRWPDRLDIELDEYEALAKWRGGGLVSVEGTLFQASSNAELPEFVGPDDSSRSMMEQYHKLAPLTVPYGQTIQLLELNDRGAWRLVLASGLQLDLGREQVEARLQRFMPLYDRVKVLLPQMQHADLRYPNGFAVAANAAPGLVLDEKKKIKPKLAPGKTAATKTVGTKTPPGSGVNKVKVTTRPAGAKD